MKKLILILCLLIAAQTYALCANEKFDTKREAYKALDISNQHHHDVCRAVAKNFRADSRFS